MSRRTLLTAALLGLAATAAGAAPAKRPNVLLIVIDTLRADRLSAYGYPRPTSPNLDRLAREGLLFENAVSAAPWTLPAHASLFTGLYPRDHHTTSNHQELAASYETLAERLGASGYETGGFSNNVWTNDLSGLKQGFATFHEMWREQKHRIEGISVDDLDRDMGAKATNERVLDWVDGRPDDGAPFFVFINYFEPHLPYRPTRPFEDDFLPEGADPAKVQRLRSFYSPREYGYILHVPWMRVSDEDLEILGALYDGEIAYVDSMLARLLEGLRERGELDDTVVVVTSDHGEHLGEHHMLDHKFSVYDPLLRVPLIVWAPSRVAAGRVAAQVQAHDVFGTLLELAGVVEDAPRELPLATDTPGETYTFAELDYPEIFLDVAREDIPGWDLDAVDRGLTAVRGPRYKLIAGSDGTVELYDLRQDPGENRDLAASESAVVEELRRALEAFEAAAPQR